MPGFIGRLIQIGLGLESPRGSVKSPPDFWLDKMNATIEDKPEVLIDESTIGRIEDSIGGAIVKEGAEGEISGKVWDRSIGLILLAAIGNIDSDPVEGETDVFQHVFSVKNDAQHPSLTIEAKNPNEQLAFVLAMLETLEIRAEVGKYVEYTATFKSKKGVRADNIPSYVPNENDFISKHITLKMADSIGEFGAESIPVRSVTLRINKNLERDDTFGLLDPADILNKQFSVEATIVLLHKNTTYKGFFAEGKKKAIRIDMENTDVNLEDTGISPQIVIDLAQVVFTAWEKTSGSDDLVMETITAKATYKKTEAKMLDCKLINTQPSYEAGS